MTDNVEATKRVNVEELNKTALAHFMKESKDEGLKKWIDLYNTGVWEVDEEESSDIIIIRDIPYEQVKKEIDDYYDNLKDGEVAYPSDVSFILKLDLEQTMKAVDELIEEGRVEVEEEEEK